MTYDTTLAALNPTAWWKLADAAGASSAADSSGNGHTGTVHGTVTFGETGPIAPLPDTAALFDGTSGYIVSGAFPTAITGSYTITAWIKNPGTGYADFLSSRYPTDTGSAFRSVPGNQLGLLVGNGTGWIETGFQVSAPTINDGNWHFAVAAVTTTGATIYLDNQSLGSASWSAATPLLVDSNHYAQISNYGAGGGAEFFPGTIAQVAVFDYALTRAQIASLWNAVDQAAIFNPPTIDEVPPISVADRRTGPSTRAANPVGWALMRHYAARPRGVAVFRMSDGTYQTSRAVPSLNVTAAEPWPPTPTVVNDAIAVSFYNGTETITAQSPTVEKVYYGGHVYELTAQETADLTAAGFGAYLT